MPERPDSLGQLSAIMQRLAVLLSGGVSPESAWRYLAESAHGPAAAMLSSVASGVSEVGVAQALVAGVESLDAEPVARRHRDSRILVSRAWRSLAAAWWVATEVGASLAPTLHGVASSLRQLAATQREVQVALAGPRSTARLVLALPAVGVLFGLALGFDTFGVLFSTVPGALCLVVGGGLMVAAWRWNRALVRSATPRDPAPGLELDLLAIAVSGGVSIERAQRTVREALEHCGVRAGDGGLAAGEVLDLSRRAGVPAAELLRGEAAEARDEARSAAQVAAAKLGVTLMMPLGLCILPAFLLLGVAPLMIAVLSSTVTGL